MEGSTLGPLARSPSCDLDSCQLDRWRSLMRLFNHRAPRRRVYSPGRGWQPLRSLVPTLVCYARPRFSSEIRRTNYLAGGSTPSVERRLLPGSWLSHLPAAPSSGSKLAFIGRPTSPASLLAWLVPGPLRSSPFSRPRSPCRTAVA